MATTQQKTANKAPAARLRVKTVQASIFANAGDQGTHFNTRFQTSYIDRNGNWKNSDSYDLSGLLALQHLVGQVIDRILELQREDVSDRPGEADVQDQASR